MKFFLEKLIIGISIITVCILIILTFIISNHNRNIASENILLKINSENILLRSNAILTEALQAVDQSIRGYALTEDENFLYPISEAEIKKRKIVADLRNLLSQQKKLFPIESSKIDTLCLQLNSVSLKMDEYLIYCNYLTKLVKLDSLDKFKRYLKKDEGLKVYTTWLKFNQKLNKFETYVTEEAQKKYDHASNKISTIQVLLLIIGLPTLLFALYEIDKNFTLSNKLLKLEEENNNELEKKVQIRTEEIYAQNEEIKSLNEELTTKQDHIELQHNSLLLQNEELLIAQELIQQQNIETLSRNEYLEKEVENRTRDLTNANSELIEYNHQLEQFAFITAHNLRAPVARILGLGNVLELPGLTEPEKQEITPKIMTSCRELDSVIKDLNLILDIKKSNNAVYVEINLTDAVGKVIRLLEKDIHETNTEIVIDFSNAPVIYSLGVYIDSILYNLIGNALKYRHPLRSPIIELKSFPVKGYTCITVSDNGLGIDLNHYKDKIFNLYKRFHSHVEGKGLGLYLVKTQITSLGGKIEVESILNVGTTFFIYLKN